MEDGVSEFLRRLVARLEAGRPLLAALTELAPQQTAPALRSAIEQVADRIRKGSDLSSAMAKHPTVFDPGSVGLLRILENEMAAAGGPRRNAPAP
jgi:type II secretory pathway component PulF